MLVKEKLTAIVSVYTVGLQNLEPDVTLSTKHAPRAHLQTHEVQPSAGTLERPTYHTMCSACCGACLSTFVNCL